MIYKPHPSLLPLLQFYFETISLKLMTLGSKFHMFFTDITNLAHRFAFGCELVVWTSKKSVTSDSNNCLFLELS